MNSQLCANGFPLRRVRADIRAADPPETRGTRTITVQEEDGHGGSPENRATD